MRQIHPVTFNEKFVASGTYTHFAHGKPSGLFEHWNIYELNGGARLLRVDWDGRSHQRNERSLLVEALYSPQANQHRIERLNIRAFGKADDPIKRVTADHIFFDDHVEIRRTIDNHALLSERIDLPPDYIVFPGTRLFLGLAIAQASSQKSKKVTVLANNPHHVDETAFQSFTHDDFIFKFLREDVITVANKTLKTECYIYRMTGSNTELKAEPNVWLDEHNILLRYLHSIGTSWDELTQYAHRPEPSTS
jgi:hypothetical protein